MFKMSIKTNILTVFLSLIALVATVLLISQYYFSKKLAIETTQKTFGIITKNINEHLTHEVKATKSILHVKSQYRDILSPVALEPFHKALKGLVQVLQSKNTLSAIYFAQENGSFYEVVNLQKRAALRQKLGAPDATYWMVVNIVANQEKNSFLDKDLQLLSTKSFSKKYDPRERTWYKKALRSDKVISTMPYLFSNIKEMGITYALKHHKGGAVLAVDYTLKELSRLLSQQKFNEASEIFLFDSEGNKFLSSSVHLEKTPLIEKLLHGENEKIIDYKENEEHYYAVATHLQSSDVYLAVMLDTKNLFKPYREGMKYAFMIALALLVFFVLPLVLLSTEAIVKPIKALILENAKIKNRDFQDVKSIETHIIEFEELSDSQVAMSQTVQEYQLSQEELLNAIIKVLAEAIDAKSPYTGGHCKRVPEIAQLLLDEANRDDGVFKDFSLTSQDGLREFEIGAWLHDCGKVTTPEYVVDKSTKLETIYNRIHEIRTRFEVLWRDAEIAYLQGSLTKEALHVRQEKLQDDFAFIATCNVGGEFMDEAKQERIRAIAKQTWLRHFNDRLGLGEVEKLRYDTDQESLPVQEKLLDDKKHHIVARENFDYEAYKREGFTEKVPEHLYNYGELYNLTIAKGTLTPEERYKINEHVIMSIKMLEKIPFPKGLTKIPEYAGTHHETLIGTGYPRSLSKEDLSVPARIMAIADIFEALSASDRPYKKAKTLSQTIKIMSFMVKDKHIDADLFSLFLRSGVYKTYAKKYLKAEQIDEVNIGDYIEL